METKIDKSAVNQRELNRFGKLDKHTLTAVIIMLANRAELPDSAYTTMSDTKWIKHFRRELADYLDLKDKEQEVEMWIDRQGADQ